MRQLSEQAQVAKIMKEYCLKLGIPPHQVKTRSSSFANGDSVDVDLIDVHPVIVAHIEKFSHDYEQGSFNGMEDIYEYKSNSKGLPRTKYLHVNSSLSKATKELLKEYVKTQYGVDNDKDCRERHFCWLDQLTYRVGQKYEFWTWLEESKGVTRLNMGNAA